MKKMLLFLLTISLVVGLGMSPAYAGQTEDSERTCTDGRDNDKDGLTDCEETVSCATWWPTGCPSTCTEGETRPTTCGVGECAGNTGIETCDANGNWINDTCDPFAGAVAEICDDTKDNDCDGDTDAADSDCSSGACLDPDQLPLHHDHSGKKALQGVGSAEEAVTIGCGKCHAKKQGNDLLSANHYSWNGNKEFQVNNFCTIAMPNAHCIKCHAGFDRIYNDYPGSELANNKIDCLVCHAQYYERSYDSGTHTTTGIITAEGPPNGVENWEALAKTVGRKVHKALCLRCHAGAGGGNKQGDLGISLATATADLDVHMGGLCMECVDCHAWDKHNVEGAGTQHPNGTTRFSCDKCHSTNDIAASHPNGHFNWMACQTCHIPVFAKVDETKFDWFYDEQGFTLQKGTNLTPVYKWWDGTSVENFDLLNDTILDPNANTVLAGPVDSAPPANPPAQTAIKVYPFYEHLGANAIDASSHKIMPFYRNSSCGIIDSPTNRSWDASIWNCAINLAATDWNNAYGAGTVSYSGNLGFAKTVMYLNLNHEVTRANALTCNDCHGTPNPSGSGDQNPAWGGWADLGY